MLRDVFSAPSSEEQKRSDTRASSCCTPQKLLSPPFMGYTRSSERKGSGRGLTKTPTQHFRKPLQKIAKQ